ncbi:unnamed protein product [Lupinus luteus]|uniref:Uncharacterized protein n=1 Tax=Lupinus luteus TaxID=3873 RepID=A0AAV1XE63_LUPLU
MRDGSDVSHSLTCTVEGQNIAIDGELNLDSFPQEHVDSYTQNASVTNNANLGSNEDNDTWMN